MSYAYRPRDPRVKLREVVARWVSAMRVAGRAPNRVVAFAGISAEPEPRARGFLVDDRRPEAGGGRYLVLEDGDVLLAPEAGWLADGDGDVEQVPDRRGEQLPHQGPERRSRG
jgi:hypothetical protein